MDIPVFVYHNAVARSLAKDLAFLAANGYRTLTAGELVDVLGGASQPPERAVALTFDDGLVSVKSVGLPLLERYDARATLFVITGLVPDGRAGSESTGDGLGLLGWEDLAELRASGRFEIGSHGHRHNPVHVPAGFDAGAGNGVGPPPRRGALVTVADYARLYDVPVPYSPACGVAAIRAVDGSPAHPSLPLFAAETVLLDGRPAPARAAVLDDLHASRTLLSDRLGVERLHLCLPYGAGSETMPALARESGFESLFWTRRPDRSANRPGDDPYRIVRRKHDFLRRLPGRGRSSRLTVLVAKVKRRLTSDPWE